MAAGLALAISVQVALLEQDSRKFREPRPPCPYDPAELFAVRAAFRNRSTSAAFSYTVHAWEHLQFSHVLGLLATQSKGAQFALCFFDYFQVAAAMTQFQAWSLRTSGLIGVRPLPEATRVRLRISILSFHLSSDLQARVSFGQSAFSISRVKTCTTQCWVRCRRNVWMCNHLLRIPRLRRGLLYGWRGLDGRMSAEVA